MRFAKAVVRAKVPILLLALALLMPSVIGMAMTRVNYDLLTYLPGDIDTMVGQDELMQTFGKGVFSFVVVQGMSREDVAVLKGWTASWRRWCSWRPSAWRSFTTWAPMCCLGRSPSSPWRWPRFCSWR